MRVSKIKVYVAGRMTNGGHANGYDLHSIREAILISNQLVQRGYVPYCPQLTLLAELIYPIPYESWLGIDFAWIDVCDVVLRLPGESKGADREVAFATDRGIPVVYSVEELVALTRGPEWSHYHETAI